MSNHPKISIITPNFNGIKYLEKTIRSIVGQNYPNLEYIIVDGGSTDGSVNIIEKYADQLAFWESAPDRGLYYALQKGFSRCTGQIMGWINSDDLHLTKSLFTIAEIFNKNNDINWIQGYPTVIDDNDRIVYHRQAVNSKLSFYLKDYRLDGRFIQQESTFWTRKLWEKAAGHISTQYLYAGDFELWIRFFHHAPLYLTEAILGSFRFRREGQLSRDNYSKYLQECDLIIDNNYQQLSFAEKKLLRRVLWARNFNNKLPKYISFLQINKFENQLNPAMPKFRFDFSKYEFLKSYT